MLFQLKSISINKCFLQYKQRSRALPTTNSTQTRSVSLTRSYNSAVYRSISKERLPLQQRKIHQHQLQKYIQKKKYTEQASRAEESFNRRLITLNPELEGYRVQRRRQQKKQAKNRYFQGKFTGAWDQMERENQSRLDTIFTIRLPDYKSHRGRSLPITQKPTEKGQILSPQSLRMSDHSHRHKKPKQLNMSRSKLWNIEIEEPKLEAWSVDHPNYNNWQDLQRS